MHASCAGDLARSDTFITKCESGERWSDLLELLEILGACGADPVGFRRRLLATGTIDFSAKERDAGAFLPPSVAQLAVGAEL